MKLNKKFMSALLAGALAIAAVPTLAFAEDAATEPTNPPASQEETDAQTFEVGTLDDFQQALKDANAGDTIKLTDNINLTAADTTGVSLNGSVINVPVGVTLDGDKHAITVTENWALTQDNKPQFHIVGVMSNATSTDPSTTIRNLTIAGNETTKAGVSAFGCQGTVNLVNVTIKNCGTDAVQVNNSNVVAENLTTEGNKWGAVNVDKDPASFELKSGTLNETLKIWTELKDEDNIITVPDTWARVDGDNFDNYAPKDTLKENVVRNETTDSYYQTAKLAVEAAKDGDVIDMQGTSYASCLQFNKSLTLKNGSVKAIAIVSNGDLDKLNFEDITFTGVDNPYNDIKPAALYIQGYQGVVKEVNVTNCHFNGPTNEAAVGITTLNVGTMNITGSEFSNYEDATVQNPNYNEFDGGILTYSNNKVTNTKTGFKVFGAKKVTVTDNTFDKSAGVTLASNWNKDGRTTNDVTIEKNSFNQAPAVDVQTENGKPGYEGDLALDHNYWGAASGPADGMILAPEGVKVTTEPYYRAASMKAEDLSNYVPSGPARYVINVAKAENGTVTADAKNGIRGDEITLTVKAADGYKIDKVSATDRKNKAIKLTDKGNGVYTFTMPASPVSVSATFVKDSTPAPKPEPEKMPFTDVADGAWYAEPVQYVYDNGLMTGTSKDLFSPNLTTTRGMIVSILYRLEGEPAVSGNAPFADVAADKYYADAINWAAANNVVSGYSADTFAPDQAISREQMACILYRYAQLKGYDTTKTETYWAFSDANQVSGYADVPMQWALGNRLITGTTQITLEPQGSATRAQVAAILQRFCETIVK